MLPILSNKLPIYGNRSITSYVKEIEMELEQPCKPRKGELFMACGGTAIAVNGLIVVCIFLFASNEFLVTYFDKNIPVFVFFFVFIIAWPIYSKKMKHSETWSRYNPFE